jgi:putative nucleotidyltransferase with HDIG domain
MYTESHSVRVAKYAAFIAAELKMDKAFLEDIWVAGVLHDIGKIGISDSILNKKERLTDEEYQLVKKHPVIAYKILSKIGLDQRIMNAVRHHHERYDGKGYPDGLTGDNINIMAAIISIADAFDAITSERSYKQPKSLELGIEELNYWKGTQFNPEIVDVLTIAFMTNKEAFMQIHQDEDVKFF